ncbi:hypothetical protein SDC9_182101 [bioreactor metagenome]|uniref:Uncharacterized protein n=1 Tax=bioreactor metagenome TaxID=1076179 RepID=A0A645H6F0_9ZZZZ
MTGDFSLLDLKFVQKLTFPISYFTEDGIPVKTTRGSKIVALTTYPLSSAQAVNDMAEPAIDMFNKVLQQQFPHDSIIAHKVYEEDFIGHDGICVEGSLKSDNSKHFLGLYSQGRSAFYVMLAICNEDETETFFRTVRKFKPTVKPTLE